MLLSIVLLWCWIVVIKLCVGYSLLRCVVVCVMFVACCVVCDVSALYLLWFGFWCGVLVLFGLVCLVCLVLF